MNENNIITIQNQHPVAEILAKESVKKSLNDLLGNSKQAEKFSAVLLNIALEPSLATCSPSSIVNCALRIAELGLPIAKHLGQAYIVGYTKRNDKGEPIETNAETIIGYKGWLSLMERAGKSVKVNPVYACDEFKMVVNGFDESISLIPNYNERKDEDDNWVKQNLKGILVSIKDNATSLVTNQFIPFAKIQKIVGISPSSKSRFSPYQNWAIEMFQAKAIKYVLSKTPLNETIAEAIKMDNVIDREEVLINIENNTPKKSFKELEVAIKAFGLQLRSHQNLAIVVGNTFQKEHLLKDLGFHRNEKNQWVAKVADISSEIEIAPEAKVDIPAFHSENDLVDFLKSLGLESEVRTNSKNESWLKVSAKEGGEFEKTLLKIGFILHKDNYVKNITPLMNATSIIDEASILF